jgi:hypothetical protein
MKLQQVKTELGVSGEGGREREREREREKESNRLAEREAKHWTAVEIVRVENGHKWKRTPEYFSKANQLNQHAVNQKR